MHSIVLSTVYVARSQLRTKTVSFLVEQQQRVIAAGVKLLFGPYTAGDRAIAVVEFPGGYIAEIHGRKADALGVQK
ncbi:MAG: hypothetical protein WB660_20370 [Candidatus Sulfotelmatobacter sp.]